MKRIKHLLINWRVWPTMFAFRMLRRALVSDSDYAWGWHCNIAMAAHDEGMEIKAANRAASRFMKNCFGIVTEATKEQSWQPQMK